MTLGVVGPAYWMGVIEFLLIVRVLGADQPVKGGNIDRLVTVAGNIAPTVAVTIF
jgi:hypothetical protein